MKENTEKFWEKAFKSIGNSKPSLASFVVPLLLGSNGDEKDIETVNNVINAMKIAIEKENINPKNLTPQQAERIKQIANEILQQNNILPKKQQEQ